MSAQLPAEDVKLTRRLLHTSAFYIPRPITWLEQRASRIELKSFVSQSLGLAVGTRHLNFVFLQTEHWTELNGFQAYVFSEGTWISTGIFLESIDQKFLAKAHKRKLSRVCKSWSEYPLYQMPSPSSGKKRACFVVEEGHHPSDYLIPHQLNFSSAIVHRNSVTRGTRWLYIQHICWLSLSSEENSWQQVTFILAREYRGWWKKVWSDFQHSCWPFALLHLSVNTLPIFKTVCAWSSNFNPNSTKIKKNASDKKG